LTEPVTALAARLSPRPAKPIALLTDEDGTLCSFAFSNLTLPLEKTFGINFR